MKEIREPVLLDGPPFASGKIHYGTIYNKYLKTLVSRIKGYQDFDYYFDTHGLPIENKVCSQKINPNYKDFENKSKDYSNIMIKDLEGYQLTSRNKPELTCDKEYSKFIWNNFKKLFDLGYVYEKKKLVLFCPSCGSVCSNNELEVKEVTIISCYHLFKLKEEGSLLIYTTQPWTLFYNQAIAYNPTTRYLKSDQGIIASQNYFIKNNLKGCEIDLKGKVYILKDKSTANLISSDLVDPYYGTGLVHLAPNHGEQDEKIAGQVKIQSDLTFKGVSKTTGKTYQKMNEEMLESDLSIKKEEITHKDYVCWRCSTPCLRTRINTIFIRTKENRHKVLDWVKDRKFTIFPNTIENNFISWIEKIEDWCVARQRKWGVRLPLWKNKKTGNIVSLNFEDYQKLVPVSRRSSFYHKPLKKITIEGVSYVPYNEILDVWFDSSLLPLYVREVKNQIPITAVESIDQIRGWYYGCTIMSALLSSEPPWTNTYCHGYLLKAKGTKYSKSSNQLDLGILSSEDKERLLLHLSNRSPWKTSVFDITEAAKSNKALSIFKNLKNVKTTSKEQELLPISERERFNKLYKWFCNLQKIEDFTSGPLISGIIDFSRNYINKNKESINSSFLKLSIEFIEACLSFFLLTEKNYLNIKNRLQEILVKINSFKYE